MAQKPYELFICDCAPHAFGEWFRPPLLGRCVERRPAAHANSPEL
jgi:hypothetical protein